MLCRTLIVVVCAACWLSLSVEGTDTTIIGGMTRGMDADALEVVGERVRLKGIDALEREQFCENAGGNLYPCGQIALQALREHIGDDKVMCASVRSATSYDRA